MIYLMGGIWLSLLYGAMTVPGSVFSIRSALYHRPTTTIKLCTALVLGQGIWAFVGALFLLNSQSFWRFADPALRISIVMLLVWMAYRVKGTPKVEHLEMPDRVNLGFFNLLGKAFLMPWRFFVWVSLIASVGVHLRGPGLVASLSFGLGALIGLCIWYSHFVIIAWLFGKKVPQRITLHSINKFRVLSFTVHLGLAIIILAPMILL